MASSNPIENAVNNVPKPSSLGILLIGVPIAIYLGGTKVGPFLNITLCAILLHAWIKPVANTATSVQSSSTTTTILQ